MEVGNIENSKERMKILLLGGTGTLSGAVLKEALNNKIKVTILNRGTHNKDVPQEVHYIKGDFYNTSTWQNTLALESFDVVIDFLSRKASDIERVYPLFKDTCLQYIFISSACVYQRNNNIPINEAMPKPNTDWDYNVAKYECELKLQELAKSAKSYYTIVRPYITYNDGRLPLGIAPAYKYHRTIIERIKAGKSWFVWDGGKNITTVTYTEDFAKAVVGLLLNEKAKNEDFHITGDYSCTQIDLVKMLFAKLKMPVNIIDIPTNKITSVLPEYKGLLLGDRALNAVFDNSKIKDAVPNLKFKTTISEGLDKVIAHLESEEPLYDYQFEARIDRLLNKCGVKTSFVKYVGAEDKLKSIYILFRYLPFKLAYRLKKWI